MPELTKVDEIAIRGTILVINPARRTVVVQSPERDTLTFKAIDRVTNFTSLKPGQLVDVRYYRVTDYLVAKTTSEVTDMAREMVRDPARAPGLPGTEMRARLWSLEGMVVRTDMAARKVEIVDPNGGGIIRSPWIKTPRDSLSSKSSSPVTWSPWFSANDRPSRSRQFASRGGPTGLATLWRRSSRRAAFRSIRRMSGLPELQGLVGSSQLGQEQTMRVPWRQIFGRSRMDLPPPPGRGHFDVNVSRGGAYDLQDNTRSL